MPTSLRTVVVWDVASGQQLTTFKGHSKSVKDVAFSLDGRLICHVNSSSQATTAGPRYRRILGWLIVVISFGVAFYNIGKAFMPSIELDDLAFTLTGAALIVLMVVIWAWLAHKRAVPQPSGQRSAA
jgi:high-affinity nickel-transport protein